MIINEPKIINKGKSIRLVSKLGLDKRYRDYPDELWFEFPKAYDSYISENMDGFVVSLLLLAMHFKDNVYIKGRMSEKLILGLREHQAIFSKYYPKFFNKVEIIPEDINTAKSKNHLNGVGTCFSGGIDSCFTLYKHYENNEKLINYRIKYALFGLIGPPFHWSDDRVYVETCSIYEQQLDKIGIKLITAKTNASDFLTSWDWVITHCHPTAGIVLILSKLFSKFFMPSAGVYFESHFSGTDPLSDHLLSTESVEIINDGSAFTRVQKTATVSNWDFTYPILNVCMNRKHVLQNCGNCQKCIRTMLSLDLYNKLKEYDTFPKILDHNKIRKVDFGHGETRVSAKEFATQIINEAIKLGRYDIVKSLSIALKRRSMVRAILFFFKEKIKLYFPGVVSLYKKIKSRKKVRSYNKK